MMGTTCSSKKLFDDKYLDEGRSGWKFRQLRKKKSPCGDSDTIYSSKKFEGYVFDESVDEDNSRWKFAMSGKKKFPCGDSGVNNYTFLESFARGVASPGMKLRNRPLVVHEVHEPVNERINQSDAALQSSSSNYSSKNLPLSTCLDYSVSHKAATDRKDSYCNKRLHVADTESVDEENSGSNFAQSGKKKSHCGDSRVNNYTSIESFSRGMASQVKKLRNRTVIVDEPVNERIHRSDTALQSSSSNYSSKNSPLSRCLDYSVSHKAATDRKDSYCSQRLHTELVSLTSDEDIDNSSTMSSNDLADTEVLSEERILEHEITSHNTESSVVVSPMSVAYERSFYSKAQLTFFCSSIKLVVLEDGAKGGLTFEWKTINLISIKARCLDPSIEAEVCLLIKSEHGQKSGILEVKCTLSDPCWSSKQELIKSMDEQYKEKWDGDLDSYGLFEDFTYHEGDCDSITICKRDFELLQPEKFINDTIVDFYIQYLKKFKHDTTARIHFFNCFFFSKLTDFDENGSRSIDSKEAFQRVRKWTKKVNIFQTDYIFIPVNFRLHWSLIIICHPGEAVNFTDDELALSNKVPCILHMDSIEGSHRGLENRIKCYLREEWKERNNDAPEYMSKKFMDMRFLHLEVPQQENSYDCGLFMLHYMELFVKQASVSFNPMHHFIDRDWFHPMEASLKRGRIKRLIFELAKTNPQRVLSPKSSYELKDEDDEEEDADVQILHETCNSKEPCHQQPVSDTCVDKTRDVKPLRSEHVDANLSDSDINGRSSADESDQKNHGEMVLYDPSTNVVMNRDFEEDFVDKKVLTVPVTNKTNPNSTDVNKSHVVEDSDDDDVFETCVVEDSDDDDNLGEVFKHFVSKCSNVETSKRRQKRCVVSRKKLRRR